jgi:molecular chaperone HscB
VIEEDRGEPGNATGAAAKRQAVPSRCMECGAALVSPLVCLGCPELRPPGGEFDHFTRLGLGRGFAIEPAVLERNYLMLARGLHPDQFARRTKEERDLAERLSAELNESYKVLRDPVSRAEYLLSLEGGPSREQDKRTPRDFLIEMLEANERIEQAESELGESARADLALLRGELQRRNDAVVATLAGAFQHLTAAEPTVQSAEHTVQSAEHTVQSAERAAALVGIREQLNVSAYLRGLVTQISELLLR